MHAYAASVVVEVLKGLSKLNEQAALDAQMVLTPLFLCGDADTVPARCSLQYPRRRRTLIALVAHRFPASPALIRVSLLRA